MMVEPNNDKSHPEMKPHQREGWKPQNPEEIECQLAQNEYEDKNNNSHHSNNHNRRREGGGARGGEDHPTGRIEEDTKRVHQRKVNVCNKSKTRKEQDIIGSVSNLESKGDKMQLRQNEDGVVRFGFQNINSIKVLRTNTLPNEIEVVHDLGIDICGYVETNRPWTSNNKGIFDMNMRRMFQNMANTQYASLPPIDHRIKYQPGGVLQTITGHVTGRVRHQGSDKYGRFAWHILQGSRDEGIVVITAYRVCQSSNAGPNTAYTHQQSAIRRSARGPRDAVVAVVAVVRFVEGGPRVVRARTILASSTVRGLLRL